MTTIPIYKYTSFGNNFILIDEIGEKILSEEGKSRFAYYATNQNYGVGSDNFLVLQACSEQVLTDIVTARNYWNGEGNPSDADYIFRMFEPDGSEAYSCGNGLMCMAYHLYRHHNLTKARILTELPTGKPSIATIGYNRSNQYCWADLGSPRPLSSSIAPIPQAVSRGEIIKFIDNLEVQFRKHDLSPISDEQSLRLRGYLVFTGEPHLVIFPETDFSIQGLGDTFFLGSRSQDNGDRTPEKRVAFGTWLLNHLGTYLNKKFANLFPSGINVNVARLGSESNVLEYRCFERGINTETTACGTGALAVSCVAQQLGFTGKGTIQVLPIRCRWEEPNARLLVEPNAEGWLLHGTPRMLVKGDFYIPNQMTNEAGDAFSTYQANTVQAEDHQYCETEVAAAG